QASYSRPDLTSATLPTFPTRRSSDLETADGSVIGDEPASQDLGFSVLGASGVAGAPHVTSATSDGGRPVPDVIQATLTASGDFRDRKSTRLNSSHVSISYAVFCLKNK